FEYDVESEINARPFTKELRLGALASSQQCAGTISGSRSRSARTVCWQWWNTERRAPMLRRLFESISQSDQPRLTESASGECDAIWRRLGIDPVREWWRRRILDKTCRYHNTRIASTRSNVGATVCREQNRIKVIGRSGNSVRSVVDRVQTTPRKRQIHCPVVLVAQSICTTRCDIKQVRLDREALTVLDGFRCMCVVICDHIRQRMDRCAWAKTRPGKRSNHA